MGFHQKMMILFFVPLVLSQIASSYSFSDVESWCNETPYPQPCKHFLTRNPNQTPLNQKSDFLKALIQVALERTQLARISMYLSGSRCHNKREKVAWADCLQLYEHAVLSLNRSIDHQCTPDDAQIWLSAALTDLDTCRTGFIELGLPDKMLPSMCNDISKLISDALSTNYVPYVMPNHTNEFPTWVRPGDRKLLHSSSMASRANILVAQDGSGNFKTIGEAVTAASKRSGTARYIIYIKAGTFEEKVELGLELTNIMFVGDGIGKTVITGNRSVGGGFSTLSSATVAITGVGFIAQDITFRNTAGAANGQAIALHTSSETSVFYRCGFEGYQDTLNAHAGRQFYKECNIYGTIDFIFGDAAAVFQNCNVYARNSPSKINTITAQGRSEKNQTTGFSFHNCKLGSILFHGFLCSHLYFREKAWPKRPEVRWFIASDSKLSNARKLR